MLLRLDATGGLGACAPVDAVLLQEDINLFEDPEYLGTEPDALVPDFTSWQDVTIQHSDFCPSPVLGSSYCTPANVNSSGLSAVIWAKGSDLVAQNDLYLFSAQMPRFRFGYFLAGMGSGTTMPPGSQGTLCLTGSQIHRYTGAVASTGPGGAFGLTLDLGAIPGHGAAMSGETWNFQAWFRDKNPGSTSNFTDAISLTLQ
jgi:hypothetical protein